VEFKDMDMEHEVDYDSIMANMFKEAKILLYEGCPTSHLATILLLLNVCNTHGVSNMFVDELFSLLRLDLFPKKNTLPKSLYEVKIIVKRLGLNYSSIHVHVIMGVSCLRENWIKQMLAQSIKSQDMLKGQILYLARCFIIFP
jgi:hypothetical protein